MTAIFNKENIERRFKVELRQSILTKEDVQCIENYYPQACKALSIFWLSLINTENTSVKPKNWIHENKRLIQVEQNVLAELLNLNILEQIYCQRLLLLDKPFTELLLAHLSNEALYLAYLRLLPAEFCLITHMDRQLVQRLHEEIMEQLIEALKDYGSKHQKNKVVCDLVNPNLMRLFKRYGFKVKAQSAFSSQLELKL